MTPIPKFYSSRSAATPTRLGEPDTEYMAAMAEARRRREAKQQEIKG